MSYNTYDKYISSEIKWFDKIPKHWDIRPIKHLAKTIPGGTPSTSNLDYWENGDIPWLPSGMVQNCQIDEKDAYKFITEKGLLNSATKYIGPNSILVALTGATCANIGYLTFKATANQSVISVEPYDTFPKYIYYALLSQREQILDKKTGGAQSGINEDNVKNILIPVMTIKEQKQIANYLDKKTAKIDATIAKNEELIRLLEEKRVSLINQVVTKGLNPDVDMKDSGIEWIGEIPKHWDIAYLKRFTNSVSSGKTRNVVENGEYLLHGSTGIIGTTNSLDYDGTFILIARVGAYAGKAHIAQGKMGITDNTLIVDFTSKINYKFLFYILTIYDFKMLTIGSGQPLITGNDVKNIKITIPPLSEQNDIKTYLDEKLSKINMTVSKIQKNISLLEEYKNSLIHHVVTGKIDVRGEEI